MSREERLRRKALKRADLDRLDSRLGQLAGDQGHLDEPYSHLEHDQSPSRAGFEDRATVPRGFLGFLKVLLLPFFILNVTAGFVGAIWLIAIGQWQTMLAGLIASLVLPFAFTVVSLPSLGIGTHSLWLLGCDGSVCLHGVQGTTRFHGLHSRDLLRGVDRATLRCA
jgi:hypothetical protein